ncbi:MAG: hypothetical protein N2C14_29185 [Planctomycetales bacterium]
MTNSLWKQLLESVTGKQSVDRAFDKIGLLIERERTNHPTPGDDGGVRELIGDDYADIELTDTDVREAVDCLLHYVSTTNHPDSRAIWALEKSCETRVVPAFIDLLRATASDLGGEDIARCALQGIITCGISSEYREEALQVLHYAALDGSDDIRNRANEYIAHYESISNEFKE